MPHSTVEPRMNTSAELRPLDVDEALDALPALYWPLLALTLGCHVTLTQGVKVWLLRRRWIYHVDDPAARIPDNKRLEMGPGNTLLVQIAGKLPPHIVECRSRRSPPNSPRAPSGPGPAPRIAGLSSGPAGAGIQPSKKAASRR